MKTLTLLRHAKSDWDDMTLRDFDRILVLAGGRLVEDGAPQSLLRRRGVYSALVDRELRWLKDNAA